MKAMRVAIMGFGKLGHACAQAILPEEELVLVGIVRRPETASEPLPPDLRAVRSVTHIRELKEVDAALVCLPREFVLPAAHELLQQGIQVVECARFESGDLLIHKNEIGHLASRFEIPAIVGAGWDPGAMSLLRGLFALLTPKGHTETSHRTGASLHHATAALSVRGVRDALCTEVYTPGRERQRYVYVELDRGANFAEVEAAIRSDPLFLNEETLVFAVDRISALEDEGHGVLMKRYGTAGTTAHQLLMLEARFSEWALAAQCMVAAARALPSCKGRVYSLYDLPPGALWGHLRAQAEREWL